MRTEGKTFWLLAVCCLALPSHANSSSQYSLSTPGVLAEAGGGIGDAANARAGYPLVIDGNPTLGAFDQSVAGTNGYNVQTSSGSAVSASYSYKLPDPIGGGNIAGHGEASASLGTIHVSATSSEGPVDVAFPLAVAEAGWDDTWLIGSPNSGKAVLQFQLAVHGQLEAANNGGAGFNLQTYLNHNIVPSASYDRSVYTYALDPGFETASMPINDIVTISVPFTFGESFSLGIFASATASNRSAGNALQPNGAIVVGTSSSLFGKTVTWLGVNGVFVNGIPITDYSITSASGTNWLTSSVPEPSSLWLAGLGLVVVAGTKRWSTGALA